jgi:hypothetical protein
MTPVARQKCFSERDLISRYLTVVCPITTTAIIITNAGPVIEAEKLGLCISSLLFIESLSNSDYISFNVRLNSGN